MLEVNLVDSARGRMGSSNDNPGDIVESCRLCNKRSSRLLCDLPDDEIEAFDRIATVTPREDGEVLFEEGESPTGLFLLCAGRARLLNTSGDHRTTVTRTVDAGEILGLGATLSGDPYEFTAETVGACRIGYIERDDFLAFLKQNRTACMRIAEILSGDLHETYQHFRAKFVRPRRRKK